MTKPLKLLCVMAHPDDETLGTGGIMARYAAEGVQTYLLTATRGEYGWFGAEADNPGPTELGKIREQELYDAARVLNIHDVALLDYVDGYLDQADSDEVIRQIAAHVRQVQPDVVVTFDPYGGYGHPDHIAISQFTTAAVTCAADPTYAPNDGTPHRVPKLYYMVHSQQEIDIYQAAFGELMMTIDGVDRRAPAWPDWAITSRVDSAEYWKQVWDAVACHQTQLPNYDSLRQLPEEMQRDLWRAQSYYRVLSTVNGGRATETDLFEGLR